MAQVSAGELAMFQKDMNDQQKMQFTTQYNAAKKERNTALILSLFLGVFGVDRFYVGDTGLGILKLLTGGVCGIMAIIDWFLIMGRTDDYNRTKAQEIATVIKAA